MTLILAIDTSCDDTSVAVTRDLAVLSCKVRSQMELHEAFGGIVPEEASRAHGEAIDRVAAAALAEAGISVAELDLVAATNGPGLLGSLLVGLNYGRGLALAAGIPFYAANHMLGHVFSPFLAGDGFSPPLPAVTLTVSGGHTLIGLLDPDLRHRYHGSTIDDAAGEIIDKLGRRLGHPYPAGPHVDAEALTGNPKAVRFPRPLRGEPAFDFSFSGLKTAFLRELERAPLPADPALAAARRADLFASLMAAIADCLLDRIARLAKEAGARACLFAGGVAASGFLRRFMAEHLPRHGVEPRFPDRAHCTDNAAMIAACAYFRARHRTFEESFADLSADAFAQFDFEAGAEG